MVTSPQKTSKTTKMTMYAAFSQCLVDAVQAKGSLAAALTQDNGGVEFNVTQAHETGYWTLTCYLMQTTTMK
ncbi:hypothetical protein ACA910_021316 [Epithemia clementina (nom. ined.)]